MATRRAPRTQESERLVPNSHTEYNGTIPLLYDTINVYHVQQG